MKIENLKLVELNAQEVITIDGGNAGPHPEIGLFVIKAGKFVLGVFAGISDGLSDGMAD